MPVVRPVLARPPPELREMLRATAHCQWRSLDDAVWARGEQLCDVDGLRRAISHERSWDDSR